MREAPRSKRMELLEVLTVGLPFCGFKILAGASLAGGAEPALPRLLGAALIGLGLLDGNMLQIFLKDAAGLLQDKSAGPFCFELIQRKGDRGFGAGSGS